MDMLTSDFATMSGAELLAGLRDLEARLRDEARPIAERREAGLQIRAMKDTIKARRDHLFEQESHRDRQVARTAKAQDAELIPVWEGAIDLTGDERNGVFEANAPVTVILADLDRQEEAARRPWLAYYQKQQTLQRLLEQVVSALDEMDGFEALHNFKNSPTGGLERIIRHRLGTAGWTRCPE